MLYVIGWLYFFIRTRLCLGVKVVGRKNVPPISALKAERAAAPSRAGRELREVAVG